jgi:hypothetical protein
MTDRLTDLIIGLQRMAEGARYRTDDLEYTQREERYELIRYMDQLLVMVDKLRASLLEDRNRLMPVERERVERERVHQIPQNPQNIPEKPAPSKEQYEAMPKVVSQGPRPQMSPLAMKEK